MNRFRIILWLEGCEPITTYESFEAEDEETVHGEIEELLQDKTTGPWKGVGEITFIFHRLIAYSVERMDR